MNHRPKPLIEKIISDGCDCGAGCNCYLQAVFGIEENTEKQWKKLIPFGSIWQNKRKDYRIVTVDTSSKSRSRTVLGYWRTGEWIVYVERVDGLHFQWNTKDFLNEWTRICVDDV